MADREPQAARGGSSGLAKPSQAEGERDTTEAAERGVVPAGDPNDPLAKPSQAEGDPETIDEALREREREG